MTLAIVLGYLVLVLIIGASSQRLMQRTGEDFFLAGRSIGSFVLLMTLFGTHMTSFALLGSSAESYRIGVGVFTLMASSSALMVPIVFFFVGTRVWTLGKEHGFVTQVDLMRHRFGSDSFGLALFVVLVLLMIPYLLIGVMGGGITLTQITDGAVPTWVGGLLICLVVISYVSMSGLRGTAWVNTFQTSLFMVLGGLTAVVIIRKLGGVTVAMNEVADIAPQLLVRGDAVPFPKVVTYTLIPLSVGMFPHIFMHWLSAERARTFKAPIIFYPLCIAAVWVPSVLLGVFGRIGFPELQGPETNSVLIRMIAEYTPGVLGGLLGAGVFAAIMSSLDSQSLSLGTMFTHDIVEHYGLGGRLEEAQKVRVGRLFVVSIVGLTFLISLVARPSIFGMAVWSFTGYASLLPILLAALFWRRASATGAWCALLTAVVLWLFFFFDSRGVPGYSVAGTGVMPVAVIFLGSALAMLVGSMLSSPRPRPQGT